MITCPSCAQTVPATTFCSSCGVSLAPLESESGGAAAGSPPVQGHQQSGVRRAGPTGNPRGLRALALGLAVLWLVASVAAGAWLFVGTETGTVKLAGNKPSLSTQSFRNSYEGDAFTGIQNAAADTEEAVVDGINGLADHSQALAESSAAAHRKTGNRLQQGLGVLIVGVGLLNFTIALSRYADA